MKNKDSQSSSYSKEKWSDTDSNLQSEEEKDREHLDSNLKDISIIEIDINHEKSVIT